jgi:hypothetical protein
MVLAGSPLLCNGRARSVFDLPLALPALFELFVKRERPQQVSYRILPNFAEFLVGRLDLGCRDRLLQTRDPRAVARVSSNTGRFGFGRCKARS